MRTLLLRCGAVGTFATLVLSGSAIGADSPWSANRRLAVRATDPVGFLPSGPYGATVRVDHGRAVVVVGHFDRRGRLHDVRRLPFTPHHRYRYPVLENLSAAMNVRGDAVVAWSYDSTGNLEGDNPGPDHTLVALVPAHGRRIIHQLRPRFASSLQTAINRRGVGVALFDTQLAVRIGRGVRARAQVVGSPFRSVADVETPIHLQVDREDRFSFVALRAQPDGTKVETAFADAAGHFDAVTHDYTITEPTDLALWPVAARNARGDEVVAWATDAREPRRDSGPVRAVVRRAGVWSAPAELSADVRGYLAVAIGADGTAAVAYPRADEPNELAKMVVSLASGDQSLQPAQALPGSIDATDPAVVVDPHGQAVVAWDDGVNQPRVMASVAPPGGTFAAAVKLGECGYPDMRLDAYSRPVALMQCVSYSPPREHLVERVLSSSP
jgi:hypothetical protein